MSQLIGGKKKDYLAEQAPLADDEYTVIIDGTNGMIAQIVDQNPLAPLPALMAGAGVQQPLGAVVRVAAALKSYREMLTTIAARTDLPEGLSAEINSLLHPHISRVVPAATMPPLPDLTGRRK